MNRFIELHDIYRDTDGPPIHVSIDSIESVTPEMFGSVVTTKTGARHKVFEKSSEVMFLVKHGPGGRWAIRLAGGAYFVHFEKYEAYDGLAMPRVWSCTETLGATRFATQDEAEAVRLGIHEFYMPRVVELTP